MPSWPATCRHECRHLEFLHSASGAGILACQVSGIQAAQSSKSVRPVTLDQKIYYPPLYQTLTAIHPCQANRKIRPRLLQCERQAVKESRTSGGNNEGGNNDGSNDKERDTQRGARLQTCRVAIPGDMSVRHDQSIRVGASQPLSQPRARHTNSTNNSRSDRGYDTAPLGSDNPNR